MTEADRGGGGTFSTKTGLTQQKNKYKNNDYAEGEENPSAVYISWNDAVAFCKWLSKEKGQTFRLPTEAEWEYACRAGTTTRYSFGYGAEKLDEYGWYSDNSEKKIHSIGLKKPNPWSLYDIHGNVYEWCQDWFNKYPKGNVTDPQGPETGKFKVYRGGCWRNDAWNCRSSNRREAWPDYRYHHLGFRVVMEP